MDLIKWSNENPGLLDLISIIMPVILIVLGWLTGFFKWMWTKIFHKVKTDILIRRVSMDNNDHIAEIYNPGSEDIKDLKITLTFNCTGKDISREWSQFLNESDNIYSTNPFKPNIIRKGEKYRLVQIPSKKNLKYNIKVNIQGITVASNNKISIDCEI